MERVPGFQVECSAFGWYGSVPANHNQMRRDIIGLAEHGTRGCDCLNLVSVTEPERCSYSPNYHTQDRLFD